MGRGLTRSLGRSYDRRASAMIKVHCPGAGVDVGSTVFESVTVL